MRLARIGRDHFQLLDMFTQRMYTPRPVESQSNHGRKTGLITAGGGAWNASDDDTDELYTECVTLSPEAASSPYALRDLDVRARWTIMHLGDEARR